MNLNASAALSTLCSGESSVIRSSADFSWNGFLLERQLAGANMRINDHADHNMLALVSSQLMRGEHQTKWGTSLVRKTAGQVTVIPKGPVPEMRLVSQAELVYCSFDGHFFERITEDIKSLRPEQLYFALVPGTNRYSYSCRCWLPSSTPAIRPEESTHRLWPKRSHCDFCILAQLYRSQFPQRYQRCPAISLPA